MTPTPVERQAFPLLLAGVASIILVYGFGLLIGIMQYQSRITSTQNGLTTGQVIFFLDIEDKIFGTIQELTNDAKSLSKVNTDFQQLSEELTFRVFRVCSLIASNDTDKSVKNHAICDAFLREIPLTASVAEKDGTSPIAISTNVPPTNWYNNWHNWLSGTVAPLATVPSDTKKCLSISSLSNDTIKSIEDRLLRLLDDNDGDRPQISAVIDIYRDDLSKIACLNQLLSIELLPRKNFQTSNFISGCLYLEQLTHFLSYRPTDYSFCTENSLVVPSNETPPKIAIDAYVPGDPGTNSSPALNSVPPAVSTATTKVPAALETGDSSIASADKASRRANERNQGTESATKANAASQDGQLTKLNNSVVPLRGDSSPLGIDVPPTTLPVLGSKQGDVVRLQPNAQRDFELVSHYRFYQGLTFNQLRGLIISPPEFLAFFLVCIGGILGALLRIVYLSYTTSQDPTFRAILIGPLLGLICALIVYILFRSGYIAITDRAQTGDGATLSPFVVAFAALAAGLLSEQAVARFRSLSSAWVGDISAEPNRWAVHLKSLVETDEQIKDLAKRLDVPEDLLRSWLNETDSVPAKKQYDISLVLNRPPRNIFTDVPPKKATVS
jgi:hypothetical protein